MYQAAKVCLVESRLQMSHEVTFANAELSKVQIKQSVKGTAYATGAIVLRNSEGTFQASLPFLCFSDAIASLKALEQQEHSAELVGEPTNPEPKKPIATVSGWFRTRKNGETWQTSFMVTAVQA
jgi:hypothetical protein